MGSAPPQDGRPAPDGCRTRTLDDVLRPGESELRLVAMIELALIQAGTPQSAEDETRRYLRQLQGKGLPTRGLAEFTEQLLADPAGLGWRVHLLEGLDAVPLVRRCIWLVMQSVWAVGDVVVEGPAMRRMDAILDLADFPVSVLDVQMVFDEYVTDIASAKVGRNTNRALVAGGMAAIVVAGWHGVRVDPARIAKGIDYVRDRIAKVDREVRTLAELVLAADVASLQDDGRAVGRGLRPMST